MSEKDSKSTAGLHSGHRERMRKRYYSSGFDGFSDHELIEFILFFSVKQRNMNDTAHLLLNKFRTFAGVLDASPEELSTVPGISSNSALLLSMLPSLFARYRLDSAAAKGEKYDLNMIEEFLLAHYMSKTTEHMLLMFFDVHMRMTKYTVAALGTQTGCSLDLGLIAESVFSNNADTFAIAHNHPGGSVKPSREDISSTLNIKNLFESIGKKFLDHFVVSDNSVIGILDKYYFKQ